MVCDRHQITIKSVTHKKSTKYGSLSLSECRYTNLVVFINGCQKYDGLYTLKAVDPLSSLGPLTSNINHPARMRITVVMKSGHQLTRHCFMYPSDSLENHLLPHLKCVLHNPSGWYTYPKYILNCWDIVRLTEDVQTIKIALERGRRGGSSEHQLNITYIDTCMRVILN